MSTKRLSRTIVEGGRNSFFRFKNRCRTRSERSRFRNLVRTCEDWDAVIYPVRQTYWRIELIEAQNDKVRATERWLDSHVGKKWDDVFSEMTVKFKTHTLMGQHVVYEHMLRDVYGAPQARMSAPKYKWLFRFYIDENGILCRTRKGKL